VEQEYCLVSLIPTLFSCKFIVVSVEGIGASQKKQTKYMYVCMCEMSSQLSPQFHHAAPVLDSYFLLAFDQTVDSRKMLSSSSSCSLLFCVLQSLAEIFQDLLLSKDDYLRALRGLLREIVRTVRLDMQFPVFALGLMKEYSDSKFKELESSMKVRR